MEIQRKKEQKKHIKEMIVQRAYERKQAQLLKAHNKRQFPYQYKDKNPYYKYDFYIGRISIKSTKAHPNKYSTQQSYYYSFYFIFCIHFSFSIYSTRLLGLSSWWIQPIHCFSTSRQHSPRLCCYREVSLFHSIHSAWLLFHCCLFRQGREMHWYSRWSVLHQSVAVFLILFPIMWSTSPLTAR